MADPAIKDNLSRAYSLTLPQRTMLSTKDYQLEIRRFITSQYLYTGVRVTACIIIPSLLLYHFGLLAGMISIPLGAVFVGMTDNPGPVQHRRNGMLVSICLNFFVVFIAGLSRFNPWLIGIEIIGFGIIFSMAAIYGSRANTIGLIALIIFILSIDRDLGSADIFQVAFYYVIGGLWYALVSLSLSTLRPYLPVQQLLGESLMETSSYLHTKGMFYQQDADSYRILAQLMDYQVRIHRHQEELRTMLFTTRRFVTESTNRGRALMLIFRDSIDLFEKVMTSQQDYTLLHKAFDGTGILETFHRTINGLGNVLYNIGLAVQEGRAYRDDGYIEAAYRQSADAFAALRSAHLKAENVEQFIRLRHILNSLRDLAGHLKQMQIYTSFDKEISDDQKQEADLEKFIPPQEKLNLSLFVSSLSLKSLNFRHAIRLTIALLIGYGISLFFPLGHGYWILLTIAAIIKPAYGLTKQRNIQRLVGTFSGGVIGFLVLFLFHSNTAMFVVMIVMMVLAYSLLKINYGLSSAALTVFLLLAFYFMDPNDINEVLQDRVIDTLIGSVIAYVVAYFVLPAWEHKQIDGLMLESVHADRHYFNTVSTAFTGKPPDVTSYKMARKDAFVTLANLSDNFQRMLSDPKNQQPNLPLYHQFVTESHMLTSYIASLSDYAQQYGSVYAHTDFQGLINIIDRSFAGIDLSPDEDAVATASELQSSPILKRVHRLLDQRKKDLESGLETTPAEGRKTLSELTTITDQFRLIHSLVEDIVKIFREIKRSSRRG